MSSQNTVLDIDKVGVTYEVHPVIQDINLQINSGEMFGLIGLNGAGKTTLIKCILALRNQTEGSIKVFGQKPGDKKARENFAYLPERFEPPWFLTGMEFLKMSLKLYNQPFHEDKMVENAEKLALDPNALKRKVHTYSKGMRQKLGLLGTILTGCKLMILDEPMSGLDPKARSLVKDALISAKKDDDTIFLSSHILADMEEICDRVAILHDSKIQYIGTPKDVIKETKSKNLERAFLHFVEKKEAA